MTCVGFLALVACSDTSDLKVEPVDSSLITVGGETDPPLVEANSFSTVERLVAQGDREAALGVVRGLIKEHDLVTLDSQLDSYWNPTSETRNELAASVLAEALALERDEVYAASYIAGLVYDLGIGVEKDVARVIEFWDHPDVHPVVSAQERLVEIYSNVDGDFYDPEKARAARTRILGASE